VPYIDVARLVSLGVPSVGKTETGSSRGGMPSLRVREDLKWEFINLFNFSNILGVGILIGIFAQLFSKQLSQSQYFKINMNKKSAKYLQGHQFFTLNSLLEI
jgi:hypothetical protein